MFLAIIIVPEMYVKQNLCVYNFCVAKCLCPGLPMEVNPMKVYLHIIAPVAKATHHDFIDDFRRAVVLLISL